MITRQSVSHLIKGNGIEIGAYHNPWPFNPEQAKVEYVDRVSYDDLIKMRDNDPNLGKHKPISRVDVIDDGQFLRKYKNDSVDFVLSSHQLEHCMSPITALKNHVRVLKPGGLAFYFVPDKRFTFDKDREIARLIFLYILDDQIKNEKFIKTEMKFRYLDYYEKVDKLTGDDLMRKVSLSMETLPDIHFHCWDMNSLMTLFSVTAKDFNFKIEDISHCGHENFIMIRKL